MAQTRFKASVVIPRADATFIRSAETVDQPRESPARALQDAVSTAFVSQADRWSARRSLAFVVGFNLVLWATVAAVLRYAIG